MNTIIPPTKICTTCGTEKPLTIDHFEFRKDNQKYRGQCRECVSSRRQAYYTDHREQLLEDKKQYAATHKEELKAYKHEHYKRNKEEIDAKNRQYRGDHKEEEKERSKRYRAAKKDEIAAKKKQYAVDHKEEIAEYKHEWRKANKERLVAKRKIYVEENYEWLMENKREWRRNKKATDPAFKLRCLVSTRIYQVLRAHGSSKNGESSSKYLPYTPDVLIAHIESQFLEHMTWKNQGPYDPKTHKEDDPSTWTWQLDHIIPQSELPYTSMEDENFKKCWALENLRPLWSKQNILEGANRTRHSTPRKKSSPTPKKQTKPSKSKPKP